MARSDANSLPALAVEPSPAPLHSDKSQLCFRFRRGDTWITPPRLGKARHNRWKETQICSHDEMKIPRVFNGIGSLELGL